MIEKSTVSHLFLLTIIKQRWPKTKLGKWYYLLIFACQPTEAICKVVLFSQLCHIVMSTSVTFVNLSIFFIFRPVNLHHDALNVAIQENHL